MSDPSGNDAVRQGFVTDPAELERIRSMREDPQWRPGAMRPEDRERLVRIGLPLVLGDRAGKLSVRRLDNDSIMVSDGRHGCGFQPDEVLGDDPRRVLEHDLELLVDELCETSVAWAERLPVCPIHPGAHVLDIEVTEQRATVTCPVDRVAVRTSPF